MKHANAVTRHLGASIGVHSTFGCDSSYFFDTTLSASSGIAASYPCNDCLGLDAPLDIFRQSSDVAQVGRDMGEG